MSKWLALDSLITILVCKKDFINNNYKFIAGKKYESWINFMGSNHIVDDGNENRFPFGTDNDDTRPYIWDYFSTIEDHRDEKINNILQTI